MLDGLTDPGPAALGCAAIHSVNVPTLSGLKPSCEKPGMRLRGSGGGPGRPTGCVLLTPAGRHICPRGQQDTGMCTQGRDVSSGACRMAGPGAGLVLLPSRSQTTSRGPCPLACRAPTPCPSCFHVRARPSPLGPRGPGFLAYRVPSGQVVPARGRRSLALCSPSSEPCCWLLSSPTDGPLDVRVHSGDRAQHLHWPPGILARGFPEGACWPLAAPAAGGWGGGWQGVSWCSELAPDSVRTGAGSEPKLPVPALE